MGAQGIALPPPYKGQNDQVPEVSVQNPYCVRMSNFNNLNGKIQLRKGTGKWGTFTGTPLAIVNYGNDNLFCLIDHGGFEFYDITSGSASLAHSDGAFFGDDEIHTLYFNGYLFFMGEFSLASSPIYYNGSSWGVSSYTWGIAPFGGCVYKNRAYFVGRSSTSYAYTDVDAVTGSTHTVNLGSVITEQADLYAIRSISSTQAVTQENVLAFIFSTGEILVYGGSYPGSASWGLVSRFRISKPIYYNTYVDAKGDSFVFTESEILSLRNLFLSGYAEENEKGIGATIKNRWRQIVRILLDDEPSNAYFIRGVYDEARDRLIVSFPKYVDPTSEAITAQPFQLIYDFTLGCWYEYYQSETIGWVSSATYFNNNTHILCFYNSGGGKGTALRLEYNSTYLDDAITSVGTVGIPYYLKSAPAPLSRFGIVRADGLEMLMKSDIYSTINFRLIGDLGAQQTAQQTSSGNGSSVSKVLANVGIEANTIQYEISGTSSSSSVGIELYASNLWVAPSEGVAR